MNKCSHELCKYWNKEMESCFFFIEGSGEVEDMPCYEEKKETDSDNRWCNTCEFKYLESECLGCAVYDECDNLIDLRNYKKEEEDGSSL